jgi:hypothetical protein
MHVTHLRDSSEQARIDTVVGAAEAETRQPRLGCHPLFSCLDLASGNFQVLHSR